MNQSGRMTGTITIGEAVTDEEILAGRSVMLQLRPHIALEAYLPRVRGMMQSDGYRQAVLKCDGVARAVAGYRIMEKLHSGRTLYVDDLSTDERSRSNGFGHLLLDWLKNRAREMDCAELQLDSGIQRYAAHRFYFRERLVITAYHFGIRVEDGGR